MQKNCNLITTHNSHHIGGLVPSIKISAKNTCPAFKLKGHRWACSPRSFVSPLNAVQNWGPKGSKPHK